MQNTQLQMIRALTLSVLEDYTNQDYRGFFEIDFSGDLSCRFEHNWHLQQKW